MLVKTEEHKGYTIEVYKNKDGISFGYVKEPVIEKKWLITKTLLVIKYHTEPEHMSKEISSEEKAFNACKMWIRKNPRKEQ